MHEADHLRAIATSEQLNRERSQLLTICPEHSPPRLFVVDRGVSPFRLMMLQNDEGGQVAHVATVLGFQKTQTPPITLRFPVPKHQGARLGHMWDTLPHPETVFRAFGPLLIHR